MGVPSATTDVDRVGSLAPLTDHVTVRLAEPEEVTLGRSTGCINGETVTKSRNLLSYWILGFCNNFTYWVLITAAVDILARTGVSGRQTAGAGPYTAPYANLTSPLGYTDDDLRIEKCQSTSTGALLVAETLPAASITLSALIFLRLSVHLRVLLVVSLCLLSYLTLGFSDFVWLDFTGVLFASVSRGLSDITFLAYAGQYERDVLSAWSSGTGVATFVGPLLYAALTSSGFRPRRALLFMVFVPLLIATSFWVILSRPNDPSVAKRRLQLKQLQAEQDQLDDTQIGARLLKRLQIMRAATKFILPLFVFYLEMYFIGSGLLELIYFPGIWLTPSQQYSWYITIQCFGVMLSRSGHRFFHTDKLWVPVVVQGIVLIVLMLDACLRFLPSVWIMFAVLFIEGLMEGTQFKSTMFKIYNEVDEVNREECLAMMPMSFFLPAVMSGFLAIPVHDALCRIM